LPDVNIDYYEQNAEAFFAETVQVDMSSLYCSFLPLLPEPAHILDAGCGSGRDARVFAKLGHHITAFDASPALVALAQTHLGEAVHCLRFQDIAWHEEFDGIWASASVLHVAVAELPDVMQRLCKALKPSGILYASFKYGSGERDHHGRRFTDLDEPGLTTLLRQVPGLETVQTWTTNDLRPGREDERWLNTLMRRTEAAWASS
jgi:SAM-dependent methyltransferase